MKPGDTFEAAIWLSGKETVAIREQYRKDMNEALTVECRRHNLTHGELRFYELRPGHERVPPIPPHIDGPDIRMLVCEADIKPGLRPNSFLGDIDKKDLEVLRAVTRRAYAKRDPKHRLADSDCDRIIEHIGPEAGMEAVRKAIDSRVLH